MLIFDLGISDYCSIFLNNIIYIFFYKTKIINTNITLIQFDACGIMKTYLKLQFSSEGELPSVIIKKLEEQGWRPIVGDRDFVMN